MKWVRMIIGRDWWIGVRFPDGREMPIARKGRVGDCIKF